MVDIPYVEQLDVSLVVLGLAALVNFASIGLRVLQTNNIIDVNYKRAYITSWLMSVVSVANIFIIADYGLLMILPIGFGGSLGCVLSMYYHSKLEKRGHVE